MALAVSSFPSPSSHQSPSQQATRSRTSSDAGQKPKLSLRSFFNRAASPAPSSALSSGSRVPSPGPARVLGTVRAPGQNQSSASGPSFLPKYSYPAVTGSLSPIVTSPSRLPLPSSKAATTSPETPDEGRSRSRLGSNPYVSSPGGPLGSTTPPPSTTLGTLQTGVGVSSSSSAPLPPPSRIPRPLSPRVHPSEGVLQSTPVYAQRIGSPVGLTTVITSPSPMSPSLPLSPNVQIQNQARTPAEIQSLIQSKDFPPLPNPYPRERTPSPPLKEDSDDSLSASPLLSPPTNPRINLTSLIAHTPRDTPPRLRLCHSRSAEDLLTRLPDIQPSTPLQLSPTRVSSSYLLPPVVVSRPKRRGVIGGTTVNVWPVEEDESGRSSSKSRTNSQITAMTTHTSQTYSASHHTFGSIRGGNLSRNAQFGVGRGVPSFTSESTSSAAHSRFPSASAISPMSTNFYSGHSHSHSFSFSRLNQPYLETLPVYPQSPEGEDGQTASPAARDHQSYPGRGSEVVSEEGEDEGDCGRVANDGSGDEDERQRRTWTTSGPPRLSLAFEDSPTMDFSAISETSFLATLGDGDNESLAGEKRKEKSEKAWGKEKVVEGIWAGDVTNEEERERSTSGGEWDDFKGGWVESWAITNPSPPLPNPHPEEDDTEKDTRQSNPRKSKKTNRRKKKPPALTFLREQIHNSQPSTSSSNTTNSAPSTTERNSGSSTRLVLDEGLRSFLDFGLLPGDDASLQQQQRQVTQNTSRGPQPASPTKTVRSSSPDVPLNVSDLENDITERENTEAEDVAHEDGVMGDRSSLVTPDLRSSLMLSLDLDINLDLRLVVGEGGNTITEEATVPNATSKAGLNAGMDDPPSFLELFNGSSNVTSPRTQTHIRSVSHSTGLTEFPPTSIVLAPMEDAIEDIEEFDVEYRGRIVGDADSGTKVVDLSIGTASDMLSFGDTTDLQESVLGAGFGISLDLGAGFGDHVSLNMGLNRDLGVDEPRDSPDTESNSTTDDSRSSIFFTSPSALESPLLPGDVNAFENELRSSPVLFARTTGFSSPYSPVATTAATSSFWTANMSLGLENNTTRGLPNSGLGSEVSLRSFFLQGRTKFTGDGSGRASRMETRQGGSACQEPKSETGSLGRRSRENVGEGENTTPRSGTPCATNGSVSSSSEWSCSSYQASPAIRAHTPARVPSVHPSAPVSAVHSPHGTSTWAPPSSWRGPSTSPTAGPPGWISPCTSPSLVQQGISHRFRSALPVLVRRPGPSPISQTKQTSFAANQTSPTVAVRGATKRQKSDSHIISPSKHQPLPHSRTPSTMDSLITDEVITSCSPCRAEVPEKTFLRCVSRSDMPTGSLEGKAGGLRKLKWF